MSGSRTHEVSGRTFPDLELESGGCMGLGEAERGSETDVVRGCVFDVDGTSSDAGAGGGGARGLRADVPALVDRYREEEAEGGGVEALRDRRLARASHRAAPVDEVMRMVDEYRTRYAGWNGGITTPGTGGAAGRAVTTGCGRSFRPRARCRRGRAGASTASAASRGSHRRSSRRRAPRALGRAAFPARLRSRGTTGAENRRADR